MKTKEKHLLKSTEKRAWELRNLICGGKTKRNCDKYDSNIDPSTTPEYAHNAFRFFHKNIPSKFQMFDKKNQLVGELVLSDILFTKATILEEVYDNLLDGMLKQEMVYESPMYTPQVKICCSRRKFLISMLKLCQFSKYKHLIFLSI